MCAAQGDSRILRTKTENEQYYLLTLAAIAQGNPLPERLPEKRRWCWPLASRLPVSDGKRKTFGITCWKGKNPVVFEYEGGTL